MPISLFKKTQQDSKQSSGLSSFFLQVGVVAVIFFLIGFGLGQRKWQIQSRGIVPNISVTNKQAPKNENIDFSLFWQVLDLLPQKYIDKTAISPDKILYGAISGMVQSLGDPYTAFLNPQQNGEIKDELAGVYEGVGIQIGFNKNNRMVVIAPLAGTPAESAGVKAKDLILKIGDKDTFTLTLPEAVDLIRGTAGTSIKLSLQHDGYDKPYDVEIKRAKITVKSVEVSFQQVGDKKIAIVKVSRFGDTTDSEWDSAVDQIKSANAIVMDMRNNPGGLLSSSVHVASEFIGGTVVEQADASGNIESLSADHQGKLLNIPMVVLVNGGSASAAEIFAGAMQDDGRSKIIGEKTFGKGTVQEPVELPGGSGLHVTVAKWLTPKGHSIHGVGISPDIEVATPADLSSNADPQRDKAIEVLK